MTEPALELVLPRIAQAELPSGLTILVLERRTLPLVSVRLVSRAGCWRDPADRPGLAAFTWRLLRHGSGTRDGRQFAAELDFHGGHFATTTGLDHLVVDLEVPSAALDEGLDLYLGTLFSPRFDEGVVERERERAIAEIVQSRDEPDEVADEAMLRSFLPGHPYGHAAQGSVATLRSLTREDLVAFHATKLAPKDSVLVAVGDVDADAFLQRLAGLFSGWAPPSDPSPPLAAPERVKGRPVVLVHDPGSGQVQYRCGNVGVARATPHWHPLSVVTAAFGGGFTSRLVREVRVNRGLTYGVHARFVPGRVPGPFAISTFTKNESLVELHEVVTGELAKLHAGGITDAELTAAKAYLAGLQVRRLETSDALGGALAEALLFGLGLDSVTGYRREIQAVTHDAASAAIAACYPKDDLVTVVVGDESKVRASCERLGPVTVLDASFGDPG